MSQPTIRSRKRDTFTLRSDHPIIQRTITMPSEPVLIIATCLRTTL